MFLRGLGGDSAYLGQRQSDAIRNITGNLGTAHIWIRRNKNDTNAVGAFFMLSLGWDNLTRSNGIEDVRTTLAFDASRVVPVANENRPTNYAVQYCIKY